MYLRWYRKTLEITKTLLMAQASEIDRQTCKKSKGREGLQRIQWNWKAQRLYQLGCGYPAGFQIGSFELISRRLFGTQSCDGNWSSCRKFLRFHLQTSLCLRKLQWSENLNIDMNFKQTFNNLQDFIVRNYINKFAKNVCWLQAIAKHVGKFCDLTELSSSTKFVTASEWMSKNPSLRLHRALPTMNEHFSHCFLTFLVRGKVFFVAHAEDLL